MNRFKLIIWILLCCVSIYTFSALPLHQKSSINLVNKITWTPNRELFYVGDTITIDIQLMPNVYKKDLMFELFDKCNQNPWTSHGEVKNIESYTFYCAGKTSLQIKTTHIPSQSIQTTFISSYVVDKAYVPYHQTLEQKYHSLQVMGLKSVYSGKDSPEFDDLKVKLIAGKYLKYIPYKIEFSEKNDVNLITESANWKILYSTADTYFSYHQQRAFIPFEWARRVIHNVRIAKIRPALLGEAITKTNSLLAQGKTYYIEEKNSLFIPYPFSYPMYDRVFETGWVSGLSQAYALTAFSAVCQVMHIQEACENADKLANSLMTFQHNSADLHWISTVDDFNYLWFQEYPVPGDEQYNILNGHIAAIAGMYSYYLLRHREDTLFFIQAGIASVKRYLLDYRMPGTTLNYFRYKDYYVADYGPLRTSNLILWLYTITGDLYFKKMASTVLADSKIS